MGLFDRLFGKNKDAGLELNRPLQLQFEISPKNGQAFANQFADAVKRNENIDLDYSVGTLAFVDNFLQRFKDEGLTVNDFAETIFVAGCYVGQVMVVSNEGKWIDEKEAELPDGVKMSNILIKLKDGGICDPVAKAFKRFHYGKGESLVYFYQLFNN